jgi:hypothetical protein
MTATQAEFIRELGALLHKHDVTISWTCGDGSDTHGIYDERMVFAHNADVFFSVDGGGVNAHDLQGEVAS